MLRQLAAFALTVSLLGLIGCGGGTETPREPPPPLVSVVEARTMTVPQLAKPNGTTRALQEVSIRARVRGFLKEQHFEEGADVKAGQLLFVIDEEPFQVALEAARAKQAEAEAALEKAQKSKMREVAAAQVALDRAVLLLARIEEARQRALLARKAAAQQDVDRAEATREKNEAQVEADLANLEQAKTDYEINILTAKASLDAARANVRDAEINLGYCRMIAPIDGRIGEAKVEVGNLVGPASGSDYTELATIEELDPMGIDIQVSSRYLLRATALIKNGLALQIERPGLEGERNHPYPGTAFFIDNTIDPTTSTFLVKGRVPNPQKTLLPGDYVKVNITVGEIPNAVVVPEQAVMEAQGGSIVYVVDKSSKVAIARVQAGSTYEGLRVVESGLEPGQTVIVEGLQLVRPGMTVQTEPAALPTNLGTASSRSTSTPEATQPAPASAPPTPEKTPADGANATAKDVTKDQENANTRDETRP